MQDETSYKKRIQGLVEGHQARERKKYERKGKNKAPEKDVCRELDQYWQQHNFFMKGFESKAKNINGVWRASGLDVGTPDRLGSTPRGMICACEVKAPGKRGTLREGQREFLVNVINRGGFALCCDGVDYFDLHYKRWVDLSRTLRRDYLMALLPDAKPVRKEGSRVASASELAILTKKQSGQVEL